MNFFKTLSEKTSFHFSLLIETNEGKLKVTLTPKASGDVKFELQPIVINGDPEKLDERFFDIITGPMEEVENIMDKISDYEKALAGKQKETSAEPAKKAPAKKRTTKTAEKKTEEVVEETKVEEVPDEKEVVEKKETPEPAKEVKEKKPEVSKFAKYEDPILEMVNADGFTITKENVSELQDLLNKLWVMDKPSELVKEREAKIKIFKKQPADVMIIAKEEKVVPPPTEEIEEAEVVEETVKTPAPPAPEEDEDGNDDDIESFDDEDFEL